MDLLIASATLAGYPVPLKEFGIDMTENNAAPSPRLWTPQGFREDDWRHLQADAPLPAEGRTILPLEVFLGLEAAAAKAGAGRLGVLLKAGEPLEKILDRLDSLPLIALDFPAFNDGRSFSKAGLLAARYAYKGIIRAVGDVLIDQIPLMLRTGFTEFEVVNPTALKRLQRGDLRGIPVHYQPAARPGAQTGTYSWRRRPGS
jgi:uncharacterized protein (DUF934 family)